MRQLGLPVIGVRKRHVLCGVLGLHLTAMSVRAQDAAPTVRVQDATPPGLQSDTRTTATGVNDDRRPTYKGMYGRQRSKDQMGQYLDLHLKLYGAYSDNISGRDLSQNVSNPFATMRSTIYPGSSATLEYSWKSDKLTMDGRGLTNVNFYPKIDNRTTVSQLASGGLSWKLSPTLTLSSNETFSYRPASALIPSDTVLTGADSEGLISAATLAFNNVSGYTLGSTVNLTKSLSARSSIAGHYDYRSSQFTGNAFNLTTHGAGATFRRGLTRNSSAHASYSFRRQGAADRTRIHDIDVGLDYDRPLSFSRRTYVSFATGSSFVQTVSANAVDLPGRFRFLGNAGVRREIGQSWSARFQYRRNLTFLEGFDQPVFTNALVGSFGGYVNRRVNVGLGVTHSIVDRATGGSRAFSTTNGSANVGFALGRRVSAYTDMAFARFQDANAPSRSAAAVGTVSRASIRAGVSLWIPLVGR